MNFHDDYFQRILEGIEETREEQIAEDRSARAPDTIERVDVRLADIHRETPGLLRSTLDSEVLSGTEPIKEQLDELFVTRTALVVDLEKSRLPGERVLFLARSLLVGTASILEDGEWPPPPSRMLGRLLTQERIARIMNRREVGETWRVLFELHADSNRWDHAEDALFHALELLDDPEFLIRRGLDYYARLDELGEDRLRRGGLSADEVDRARWELLERLDASDDA